MWTDKKQKKLDKLIAEKEEFEKVELQKECDLFNWLSDGYIGNYSVIGHSISYDIAGFETHDIKLAKPLLL